MANYKGKRVAQDRWAVILLAVASVVLVLAVGIIIYQKYWNKTPERPDASQDSSAPSAGSASSGEAPDVSDEPQAPDRKSVV